MGATESVARFAASVRYEDLPELVRHEALLCLIDTVGVMLAAANEPVGAKVWRVAAAAGGEPQAHIPGTRWRAPVGAAALVGGTLAHALDFDDSCDLLYGHPSAPLAPACLALGEHLRVGGRELITAFAVGVEVSVRVGGALPLAHYEHGWHVTATAGVMGTAAAAARLLKLDAAGIRTALAIAASMASGIKRNFGTMVKPFHVGHTARCGVEAAYLAAAGFTADPDILESPKGYYAVFAQGPADIAGLEERPLGNPWVFERPGIRRKYLPCCSSNHRPVEAAIGLVEAHQIDPDAIVDVECRVLPFVPANLIRSEPADGLEAKFCLEYCVARAIMDRKLTLAHFTDEAVADGAVRALARRVRMVVVPPPDPNDRLNQFAEVVITTRDGSANTLRVNEPLGHPNRPLTTEDVHQKFLDCAALTLPLDQCKRALGALRELESLESLGSLLKLLTPA